MCPNGTYSYPRYELPNQVSVIITRGTTTVTTTTTVYQPSYVIVPEPTYITVPTVYIVTVPLGTNYPPYVEVEAVRWVAFSGAPVVYVRTDTGIATLLSGAGWVRIPVTTYTTVITTTTVSTTTDPYLGDDIVEITRTITYTTVITSYTSTYMATKYYYQIDLPVWTLTPITRYITQTYVYTTTAIETITSVRTTTAVTTTTVSSTVPNATTTATLPVITAILNIGIRGYHYADLSPTTLCSLTTINNLPYYTCSQVYYSINTITFTAPILRIYVTPVYTNNRVEWTRLTTTQRFTYVCSLTPLQACQITPAYTVAYPIGYEGMYLNAYLYGDRVISYVIKVAHYAPPDFSLDDRIFATEGRIFCLIPGYGMFPQTHTLRLDSDIYTRIEYDPPRLLYIELRYTLVYTHTRALDKNADQLCYIVYVNPYPRLTLTYFFTTAGFMQ